MMQSDEFYMKKAYLEAKKAFKRGEVPVGAVIVDENGEILATGYNKKEEKNDPSLHAEVVAIRKACAKRNNWRLNNCKIYVSLEPCLMCSSLIFQSNIKEIIVGLKREPKNEPVLSDLLDYAFEHQISVKYLSSAGFLKKMMEKFFQKNR